jgi:hypothetical protein
VIKQSQCVDKSVTKGINVVRPLEIVFSVVLLRLKRKQRVLMKVERGGS